VVIIAWLVGGAANGAQNVCVQAVIRARAQPHLRGRAFSAASSAFQTATVWGLAAGAAAVPAFGAQGAVIVSGALPAVAGVVTVLLARRGTPLNRGLPAHGDRRG
jgi:MFS family permease